MKKLTLVICFIGLLQAARAQFEGILYYECTLKNQTLTTIYATKTKLLLEAKTYPIKEGAADIGKGKEQDALIFDFEARQTTRISSKRKWVAVSAISPVTDERVGNLKDEDISVEDKGEEKVGTYNCHHYVVKIRNKATELWITKDLGVTPLCLLSQFDYYPEGTVLYTKLSAAGADGVVVRSKSGDVVVSLTNVQRKTVPASYFEVPEGYTKVKG
jgi:uncharacterized protein DUF4412